MMQIRSELALMRWRLKQQFSVSRGGSNHLRWLPKRWRGLPLANGQSIFTHIPGLRVLLMPSNALDANGLCEQPFDVRTVLS